MLQEFFFHGVAVEPGDGAQPARDRRAGAATALHIASEALDVRTPGLEQLQAVLNNHIIAGKLTTHDLQDGAILKTTAGHQLKVSKRDGQVRINGALVEKPDEMSSNGVLHKIEKVLLPTEEE